MQDEGGKPTEAWSARRLAVITAMILGVLLAIRLADVLLLIFASVLVAVLLHAIAQPIRTRTRLNRGLSLGLAVFITVSILTLTFWAFGSQLEAQISDLAELLPPAWADLKVRLSQSGLGQLILQEIEDLPRRNGGWLSMAPKVASNVGTAVAALLIVSFAGLYLAFHPETYASGFLKLFPHKARPRAAQVMAAINEALKRWLLAQILSMLLVGVTTTLGLWAVGVPSPLGLGMLAGLGQFVPVVGPTLATIPGLVVALAAGPEVFALALFVYVLAAQIEANVLTPLVLRQMAELPMAVTLFAVLGAGVLLGPLGVLLATPLAVVVYVLVKKVYVEGVLGEPVNGAADPAPSRRRRPKG